MAAYEAHELSQRFTSLSDRFRSMWTFYQFLGGVFKHQGSRPIPFTYDFQTLYKRLQELLPRMDLDDPEQRGRDLDAIEEELERIHQALAEIEREFPPSLLRRFFDHLKRQDEKILFALVKFYLLSGRYDQDSYDKMDILLTRLAEAPLEDGRVLQRDPSELRTTFERLAELAGAPQVPAAQEQESLEAIRDVRRELRTIADFQALVDSSVYDRFRDLKQSLGKAFLHPPILTEIVVTNIEAKNRFQELYQEEEVRILEDTNRIFEIERYIERNPDLAHDELRQQIEIFRQSRARFDSGRRDDNVKREDVLELRQTMHRLLEQFDSSRPRTRKGTPVEVVEPPPLPPEVEDQLQQEEEPQEFNELPFPEEDDVDEAPGADEDLDEPIELEEELRDADEGISISQLLPPDPLVEEHLHRIIFALELVIWQRSPEQATDAIEVKNLRLEPSEVNAYRKLAQRHVLEGSHTWDLLMFFLTSAALRLKMEDELEEIRRLCQSDQHSRLNELLGNSAQSLERARRVEKRFQWYIDDMLYRSDSEFLEEICRSHHRLLFAFSALWLEHQTHGGMTPL